MTIEVENSASGEIIAQLPVVEPEQLEELVARAREPVSVALRRMLALRRRSSR